ncbi:MAG TPA: DMT family transporter [Dongiaceae bacterium]
MRAYQLLDASAVQPISYLGLVYASLFGVLIYGETLTWNMVAGTAIVVGAGIFTVWREYALRHRVPVQAVSAGCDKELATPLIRVAPPDVQE